MLVAFAAASLVLCMVLALDAGRLYLARTQLQTAADSAARAAMRAASDPRTPSARDARQVGRKQAKSVLVAQKVVDGGADYSENDLSYGSYDFVSEQFSAEQDGSTETVRPAAVQITLERTPERGKPILGLFGPMGVRASAVASVRCRQVVLAVDLSASFAAELPKVREALESLVQSFEGAQSRGDTLALVSFNGAGRDNLNAAAEVVVPPTVVSTNTVNSFKQKVRGLESCPAQGTASTNPCLGTNTAEGLKLARNQFDQSAVDSCNGDRLIVLLSDGVPCQPNLAIQNPSTATFTRDARAEAARAVAAGVSLSTIFVAVRGSGAGGGLYATCPNAQGNGRQDAGYMASLVGGDAGQFFRTPSANQLQSLLARSVANFPVVIVR